MEKLGTDALILWSRVHKLIQVPFGEEAKSGEENTVPSKFSERWVRICKKDLSEWTYSQGHAT